MWGDRLYHDDARRRTTLHSVTVCSYHLVRFVAYRSRRGVRCRTSEPFDVVEDAEDLGAPLTGSGSEFVLGVVRVHERAAFGRQRRSTRLELGSARMHDFERHF